MKLSVVLLASLLLCQAKVRTAETNETLLEQVPLALEKLPKGTQTYRYVVEKPDAIRLPVGQFAEHKVLNGPEEFRTKLNEDSSMDDSGRPLFFLSSSQFLNGKRALDWLREGKLHKVTLAVEGYVQ